MKPQLVPVILGGRRGVRPFDPIDLFTGGVQGAWYDPSDYSTLFQDSAGTTPVTAVEQPVGLMLDKSQGLVLGSELVVNGDFSNGTTGWSASFVTLAAVSGKMRVTSTADFARSNATPFTTVVGRTYLVTGSVEYISGPENLYMYKSDDGASLNQVATPTTGGRGEKRFVFVATATTTYVAIAHRFSGTVADWDNISVKELPGNHASQATAASRPVLRARYNLLTYSEQFDNAAWAKQNLNTTGTPTWVNVAVAPDGTTTADKLIAAANSLEHRINNSFSGQATAYTFSLYIKSAEWPRVALSLIFGATAYISWFDASNGTSADVAGYTGATRTITSVGNGWYRIAISASSANALSGYQIYAFDGTQTNIAGVAGDGTSGVLIWGADLRTGSSAGTYQRIAAATDYATAGFLPYLAFDGTDDSFGTNSINFSATDKMSVCAGVTKLSDAALGMVAELSANLSLNNGSFWILAPLTTGASADFDISFKGTNQVQVNSGIKVSPVTAVITGTSNIAAPSAVFRYNGTQTELDTGSQGTGNFGNYPLYIGRRGNASLPFNGRIYQMVVCGKTLSASELASTEAYVNSKTGAY